MRALHRVAVAIALLCISLLPMMATADSITYTSSFMASGTVNGTPFDGNVTFSLTSDTNADHRDLLWRSFSLLHAT